MVSIWCSSSQILYYVYFKAEKRWKLIFYDLFKIYSHLYLTSNTFNWLYVSFPLKNINLTWQIWCWYGVCEYNTVLEQINYFCKQYCPSWRHALTPFSHFQSNFLSSSGTFLSPVHCNLDWHDINSKELE